MNNLEQNFRQQLLSAEQQLDDQTLRRLRQARATALTATRKPLLSRLMVPAMGMVTASVVALVLVVSPFSEQTTQEAIAPDNAAFYEDLEFYYWLAENDPSRRS